MAPGVGNIPGLKIHPRQGPDEHIPPPLPTGSWWCWGRGWGQEIGEERWEERMINTGKKQPKEAPAAAEGIKWNKERISQLGIVPAKIFSLLIKKIKLTS